MMSKSKDIDASSGNKECICIQQHQVDSNSLMKQTITINTKIHFLQPQMTAYGSSTLVRAVHHYNYPLHLQRASTKVRKLRWTLLPHSLYLLRDTLDSVASVPRVTRVQLPPIKLKDYIIGSVERLIEPQSFDEAHRHSGWRTTMQQGMESIL